MPFPSARIGLTLALCSALFLVSGCTSPKEKANKLYVEAANAVQKAGEMDSPKAQVNAYRKALSKLARLRADYPGTDRASEIVSGDAQVDGLTIQAIRERARVAQRHQWLLAHPKEAALRIMPAVEDLEYTSGSKSPEYVLAKEGLVLGCEHGQTKVASQAAQRLVAIAGQSDTGKAMKKATRSIAQGTTRCPEVPVPNQAKQYLETMYKKSRSQEKVTPETVLLAAYLIRMDVLDASETKAMWASLGEAAEVNAENFQAAIAKSYRYLPSQFQKQAFQAFAESTKDSFNSSIYESLAYQLALLGDKKRLDELAALYGSQGEDDPTSIKKAKILYAFIFNDSPFETEAEPNKDFLLLAQAGALAISEGKTNLAKKMLARALQVPKENTSVLLEIYVPHKANEICGGLNQIGAVDEAENCLNVMMDYLAKTEGDWRDTQKDHIALSSPSPIATSTLFMGAGKSGKRALAVITQVLNARGTSFAEQSELRKDMASVLYGLGFLGEDSTRLQNLIQTLPKAWLELGYPENWEPEPLPEV